MIRQLELSDLDSVERIFLNTLNQMRIDKIDQWDELYPTRTDLQTDITNGFAYGFFHEGLLKGYVALNTHYDKEYDGVDWSLPHDNSLIVHRLAVEPSFRNMGVAGSLMLFAENLAQTNAYTAIRFDAFSDNPLAVSFYKRRGYRLAGDIILRKGKFFVFEKAINIFQEIPSK